LWCKTLVDEYETVRGNVAAAYPNLPIIGVTNINAKPIALDCERFAVLVLSSLAPSAGLMSEILLKKYAYRPQNILGTWDAGKALLSFFANSQGSSTTVRISARFAGFESNVIRSWVEWPTKGVLENYLLDRIAEDLGVPVIGSG
jgi:hypothetical protein